ncbi:MAG: hypothetical protein HQK79_20180 [Desulfobacterales bacterium]|nr:hypothetical protein [Desulfobacterales bacterium]
MDLKDLGIFISKSAPLLGSVICNPAGAITNMIISTIASKFNTDANKPEELVKAIQADPQSLIKLKQIEKEYNGEIELELERIRLADTNSAREREKAIFAVTGKKDIHMYALSWVIVAGFLIFCALLMYHAFPKEQENLIFLIVGTLSSGFGTVIQYFFGSSKGSADKTQMMIRN